MDKYVFLALLKVSPTGQTPIAEVFRDLSLVVETEVHVVKVESACAGQYSKRNPLRALS